MDTKTHTEGYRFNPDICGTRLTKGIYSENKPESDLSCGWDEQTEAVYGNIDSDTHACKSQVTLPHDCLQRFVGGLKESNTIHL